MAILTYQLLAVDSGKKARCENAEGLVYLIRGFTGLWKFPKVVESSCSITDGGITLNVSAVVDKPDATISPTEEPRRAFILTLKGHYADIEPRREPLAAFLKDQDFQSLYVLRDEVSETIACKLYPQLYRMHRL